MYLDCRYWLTFGFLDDVTRKWGKYKPSVFIRGNHDIGEGRPHPCVLLRPSPRVLALQSEFQGIPYHPDSGPACE